MKSWNMTLTLTCAVFGVFLGLCLGDWRADQPDHSNPYTCSLEGEECRNSSYRQEDCCDSLVCIEPEPQENIDNPICTSEQYIPAIKNQPNILDT